VWVKYGNDSGHVIKAPTTNCRDVYDLIKLIKAELSPDLDNVSVARINLYSSNDSNAGPLDPGLEVSALFTSSNAAGATSKNPLYIKIIDADIASKGKYIVMEAYRY
jgi:hypothetical protein